MTNNDLLKDVPEELKVCFSAFLAERWSYVISEAYKGYLKHGRGVTMFMISEKGVIHGYMTIAALLQSQPQLAADPDCQGIIETLRELIQEYEPDTNLCALLMFGKSFECAQHIYSLIISSAYQLLVSRDNTLPTLVSQMPDPIEGYRDTVKQDSQWN